MNIAQPVNSRVDGVSFTFYEAAEVRRMSVKQVVNPVLLDALGNPTNGGLYDPAMGPFTKNHLCGTCSLSYFNCPGHFGHIELPAPVVNPMMFDALYQFLQGCCPYCHHFTFSRVTACRFAAKLRLLEFGLVKEASDLDDLLPKSADGPASGNGNDDDGDGDGDDKAMAGGEPVAMPRPKKGGGESPEAYIQRINKHVADALADPSRATYKATTVNKVRRALIKELIWRSRGTSCQNCRGPVPKLRRDGHLKIFREPLQKKQLAQQQAKGLQYRDVMALDAAAIEKETAAPAAVKQAAPAAVGDESEDDDKGEGDSSEDADAAYNAVDAHPKKQPAAPQRTRVYMTAIHLRNHMRLLFGNEAELVRLLFQQRDPQMATAADVLSGARIGATLTAPRHVRSPVALADIFFIEALPVPPTKFRPASVMNDEVMENPQNVYLGKVLRTCVFMRNLISPDAADARFRAHESRRLAQVAAQGGGSGGGAFERVVGAWVQLQQDVNNVMDSSKNPTLSKNGSAPDPGIRQILEKKEGLFRQNMMGKRVNFAARSVIAPDPNMESDEVGVPLVFAQKLTFPEPVTPHNVRELRQLVINGPETWPGAESVQNEDGSLVYLAQLSHESRVALANQLLTPQDAVVRAKALGNVFTTRAAGVGKKVLRHLRNGDVVVMNRQPTLHRASMTAMRAHVLPGERTLRFHYMNCNQFNSDFDGDEMNMHFPQSEAARSELHNIMGADMTYINPTNGEPLRGLIQDSVDGGVILTKRDTLLTRSEYQELIYWALQPETQPQLPEGRVQLLPPAIFKPRPMWTGKQVVSTLLLNLTWGHAQLNLVSKDKIGKKLWGPAAAEEERVLVLDGELLVGVLDKSQFGASAYGLVHSVYELYSPAHAGRLLSALSRLFLRYLQEIGFSCRMEDLLLDPEGDAIRREIMKKQGPGGIETTLGFLGMGAHDAAAIAAPGPVRSEFHTRMEEVLRDDAKLAQLDGTMSGFMNTFTSEAGDRCLPAHLRLPFPHNNMVVMTASGAKGSNVNLSQITCCLGQQSLEGRRVPLMVSGKSLPSFAPFDASGRAGGYVANRFLTGLKPQEFYFHCMAGREGLIDTAVKTSRSGYLQRCLIKHLEGIQVHYDYTVRDSDGSVIQFQYGEDALDVLKCQYLSQFDFAAANYRALRDRLNPASAAGVLDDRLARKYSKKLQAAGPAAAAELEPVSSRLNPSRHLGAVSETFGAELERYLELNPSRLLRDKAKREPKTTTAPRPSLAGRADRMLASVSDTGALAAAASPECSPRNFRMLQYLNYIRALIDPGESVGLIAAQGIGEPSTQMTLNTFHLAGFGAKNVTLGIPRLREIVMVASDNISAPLMDIPMAPGVTKEQAEAIAGSLSRLTLTDVIERVEVRERLTAKKSAEDRRRYRQFTVRLQLFPSKEYNEEYGVTSDDIEYAIESQFIGTLESLIAKELKRTGRSGWMSKAVVGDDDDDNDDAENGEDAPGGGSGGGGAAAAADSEAESDIGDDADADADDARTAARRAEQTSYDEPDEDDQRVLDNIDAELDELDNEAAGGGGGGSGGDGMDVDEEGRDESALGRALKDQAASVARRQKRLCARFQHVVGYNFVDNDTETYAEIRMQFPAATAKFLMLNLAEQAVRATVVNEIKGISAAFVNKSKCENDTDLVVSTAGASIRGIWDASLMPLGALADAGEEGAAGRREWVDLNRLYTNDIAAILRVYGVEAARTAIVREISGVFWAYKIVIDRRHLSLVADYMTFEGGFKPFNRIGLSSSPAPFAKMSFESTCTFLQEAAVYGDFDDLRNPSSRIVMGQPVRSGTGAFDVLVDLAVPAAA
ncbi:hypothetical protein H4R18_000706 [Coemansia javaensis]|uniref:DNA-directed RNA polymerase subunit n=1 Tax=Coemansia javaensis TaxID=2761396 RepID=A0A9W8HJ10_9FUNG|nr:hypothetical protein H4R18_000706 [Coemansia javaensis]